MAYPLIIFGAGASNDYSSECGKNEKISPLTKNLVDKNFLFGDLLNKYPSVGDLLSDVVLQVRGSISSFEEALTQIQERTAHSIPMRRQFIALEFYLQELFERVSNQNYTPIWITKETRRRMHQINNYRIILNRINTYSNGKACVVTFNYDTLFENGFTQNLQPQRIGDYISGDLKLIKLHGSHDWVYIHRKSGKDIENAIRAFDLCMEQPNLLAEAQQNKSCNPYHKTEIHKRSDEEIFHLLPVLAIPLIGKDSFICHETHIKIFEKTLPKIDRILIIGWQARDSLLLKTLKENLPKMGYNILVVSNSKNGADKIATTIKKALGARNGLISSRGGGFSGFVSNEISHTFFKE